MGLNDDVDNEFGNNDTTVVIDTPNRDDTTDNNVPDETIFTKGITPNRLPELDAEFVIQKSKEDRLVELAEKSAEIEQSGGISRSDVIAVESIIEDLEGNGEVADKTPPVVPKPKDDDDELPEPVAPKQPLGNPRLYTEEKSTTEFQPAMTLMRSNFEKAYNDLKASVVDLGKKLLSKADEEIQEKRLAYAEINTQFNKNIIKFLDEYESEDLEHVKCNFTRVLKWNDLMGVSLHLLRPHLISYDEDKIKAVHLEDSFEGTKTGELLQSLRQLFQNDFVFRTIGNFVYNDLLKITTSGSVLTINPETGETKPWKEDNSATATVNYYSSTQTVGSLFAFIGTNKLKTVIDARVRAYDYCKQVIRECVAKCEALESNQESNIKENLEDLTALSGKINESKMTMMAVLGEIGAVFAVYEVLNSYMVNMAD